MTNRKFAAALFAAAVFIFISLSVNKAQSLYEPVDLNKVKWSLSDFGKMWTFDDVPVDKFEREYGFKPAQEWLDEVQMSALQFGGGCSAAFVSGDGLIMTNHHCGRDVLQSISPEGEDYLRDGFYAADLKDEIKIKNLYVDQLMKIENVTDEVIGAMNKGKDDNEKVKLRDEKIIEIEKKYSDETGLLCKVIQLYNGGKYSLYMYKRYNDIRLVMAPDFQIAATGWDWDNFTYPRYELDFMFYRAYDENGKPVKSPHHFTWSKKGADEGELIFTVGRPGRTQRLYSYAYLEFLKDKIYKNNLLFFNELYQVYYELFEKHPERYSELLNMVMGVGNGRKSYAGRYMALRDNYIMAKKKDFEKDFRAKIAADPELNKKYGFVWDAVKSNLDELRKNIDEATAFSISNFSKPVYFKIAENVIKYANEMKLPESERSEAYKGEKLKQTLNEIFPASIDAEKEEKLVRCQLDYIAGVLGDEHLLVTKLFGDKRGDELANAVISSSAISSKEKVAELLKKTPDEILNSNDTFIYFLVNTQDKLQTMRKSMTEINNTLSVLNQLLGEAAFHVYGEQIPPDATSTLRISDGAIKGYEYNGTIAPGKTVFYGLYDRWYSFGKKPYPWGLHPRWQNIPKEFDLSVPVGFASTNDIVGGNSGSSIINKNREVVGLVHDGNLESLAGDFIFLPEVNRTVATDSYGLMEALKYIYKTDKLVKELESSKLP